MTENKSKNEKCSHKQEFHLQPGFINNHGNILFYKDITKNGHKLSTYEVCRLLNQLYEENEELKQENHDIKHTIEELYYTYIYKPSENYDEDSCDEIIRGILKGVEKR